MSRSMTQINMYMKIMHNVKVNDSNQYLYENPAQCQGQCLINIYVHVTYCVYVYIVIQYLSI